MRRIFRYTAVALLAVLAVDWAPGLPPLPGLTLGQVRAQSTFFPTPIGSGGQLANSDASVSVTNTTTETSVWQYVLTPSLIATASSVGALGTPIYTGASASGLSTTPLYTAPAPLHLRMIGTLAGAAGTTVNLGINFGLVNPGTQGLATLTLNNNISSAITTPSPYLVDVWITPIASSSATPTSANGPATGAQNDVFILARAQISGLASATVTMASTVTSINLASPTALNVVARWAAAASGSALTFYNRILVIGQ